MSGGYYTPEDRRPPITPGLAFRVAALGFVALALFAIVFFRLWFLQVLAGDQYLQEANHNRVRNIAIQAPRGEIVDRNGKAIVTSRLANVVRIDPRSLPAAEREAASKWGSDAGKLATRYKRKHPKAKTEDIPLPKIPATPPELRERFARIGKILDRNPERLQRLVIQSLAVLPYEPVKLRVDVPRTMIVYLQEHKRDFPGIVPDTIFVRDYPQGKLAAQLLGNVGQVSDKQLKKPHFRGVSAGTVVGQAGVEYEYDRSLRGRDGTRKLQVDSLGNYVGELTAARRNPIAGRNLRLTIDLDVQKTAQKALENGMVLARQHGNPAKAGAFIAMNPGNGQIYAMGSAPSFDPTEFTKTISYKRYRYLGSNEAGKPLVNRAVNGAYPTGSTFKPITALAALQGGYVTPQTPYDDKGCLTLKAEGRTFCNAHHEPNGVVNLVDALKVSSDVYFYNVGILTNTVHTEVIQSMARKLGLGRSPDIDIPAGGEGNVPDWKWRAERGAQEKVCREKHGIPLGWSYSPQAAARQGCGISDMRPWSEGDNMNLAVGQGDVQASPLQMAVAYSTIVEHGRIPRPHLGLQIDDSQGRFERGVPSASARKPVHIDEADRRAVLDGLHAAASAAGGTSTEVWKGWNQDRYPVFGKTGTAEICETCPDQAWYLAWIKDTQKPNDAGIVIAVTIEKGGFGAESAAPVARQIASQFFLGKPGKLVAGTSQTL